MDHNDVDLNYAWGFSEEPYLANVPFDGASLYPLSVNPCINQFGLHFINDYRSIKSQPNTDAVEVWDSKYKNTPRIFLISNKDIEIDEEILINYGEGYWNDVSKNIRDKKEKDMSNGIASYTPVHLSMKMKNIYI